MKYRVNWSAVEPINWNTFDICRPIQGLPTFTRAYIEVTHNGRPWPFEALFSGGPSGHYMGTMR